MKRISWDFMAGNLRERRGSPNGRGASAMRMLWALQGKAPGALALCFALLTPAVAQAAVRTYYVAAQEVRWDYAPDGRDRMTGKPFSESQQEFTERGPSRIGRVYVKAVYREYTDATFMHPKPRPRAWEHLGLLGPVLRSEVGDTLKVVFKNMTSRNATIHPHGVFYAKNAEGTPYNDGTREADKGDDAVAPGKTYTYRWEVPERAGPGPSDPDTIPWLYHSHFDEPADTNAGLIGVLLISGRNRLTPQGRPKGVDREFVTLFKIFDENESPYLDRDIELFADPKRVKKEDEDFVESNLMHSINGYVFANLPGLEMRRGERVRWYLLALGNEVDLHTPHWHGNTGLLAGRRIDTLTLLPATSSMVDMVPDNPGVWMFHCHVDDHLRAGMTALYRVTEK